LSPRENAWQTDEPCPSCGAEMVLLDDGLPEALAECRSCGYRETWQDGRPGTSGGDNW
jgi:transcription elongation factor Elf1